MTSIAAAKFDSVGFETTKSNAPIAGSAPALLPAPPASKQLAVRPFAHRFRSVPVSRTPWSQWQDMVRLSSHSAYTAGSAATRFSAIRQQWYQLVLDPQGDLSFPNL